MHMDDKAPRKTCKLCGLKTGLAVLSVFPKGGVGQGCPERICWGVYLLREAAALLLPFRCVMPHALFTYHTSRCPECHGPTVPTGSHLPRRLHGFEELDKERQQLLNSLYAPPTHPPLSAEAAEAVRRRAFPRRVERFAFHGTERPSDILLSAVAAGIAYEYKRSPLASLQLSDIPYAPLLSLVVANKRFTMLEGPEKTIFFAVPGTHNARTAIIDIQISQVDRELKLYSCGCNDWGNGEDVVDSDENGHQMNVPQQNRKWKYKVHKGFAEEAERIDLLEDTLLRSVDNGYRIVFCGHSMGGAVAILLALRLLRKYHNRRARLCRSSGTPAPSSDTTEGRTNSDGSCCDGSILSSSLSVTNLVPNRSLGDPPISCITFGAPLIGNAGLRECVEECHWASCFHHVVVYGDSIPLLTFHSAFKRATPLLQAGSALVNKMSPLVSAVGLAWNSIVGRADVEEWSRSTRRARRREDRAERRGGGGGGGSSSTSTSHWIMSVLGRGANSIRSDTNSSLSTPTSSSSQSSNAPSPIAAAVANEDAFPPPTSSTDHSGMSVFTSGEERMRLEAQLEAEVGEEEHHAQNGAVQIDASSGGPSLDYQCFGRYHFLRWPNLNYCSSMDHVTTMTILEEGSHGNIHDHHSVYGYNRALMMHLYTSPPAILEDE